MIFGAFFVNRWAVTPPPPRNLALMAPVENPEGRESLLVCWHPLQTQLNCSWSPEAHQRHRILAENPASRQAFSFSPQHNQARTSP